MPYDCFKMPSCAIKRGRDQPGCFIYSGFGKRKLKALKSYNSKGIDQFIVPWRQTFWALCDKGWSRQMC